LLPNGFQIRDKGAHMVEAQGERFNKCCSSDGFRWSNAQSTFAQKQFLSIIHIDNETSGIKEKY